MPAEKLPLGFVSLIAVGIVAFGGILMFSPGRTSDEEYAKQAPKVNIDTIGVHSEVGSHDASLEKTVEHIRTHERVEKSIFDSPDGRYTQADIDKNGALTPAEKFKGIPSKHDMMPKPGTRICPITETAANPEFAWWVDGKKHLFCCPPCIEEFVIKAKKSQEPLLSPESYTKS